eukprot:s519_g2.t1
MRGDQPDDVTLAKLYDSVGSCYDEMGRHDEAVSVLQKAKDLYDRSIGTESPLYGSACERLSRALVHAGRHQEGLDNLIEAFTVIALQDAVHPTPLFELLGIALEEIPITKEVDVSELARLEMPIQAAVRNMRYRGLDQDGNCGVLYERMARALVLCSSAGGTSEAQQAAAQRRQTETWRGLADLKHISMLIDTELQALENQDAAARLGLPQQMGQVAAPAPVPQAAAPVVSPPPPVPPVPQPAPVAPVAAPVHPREGDERYQGAVPVPEPIGAPPAPSPSLRKRMGAEDGSSALRTVHQPPSPSNSLQKSPSVVQQSQRQYSEALAHILSNTPISKPETKDCLTLSWG